MKVEKRPVRARIGFAPNSCRAFRANKAFFVWRIFQRSLARIKITAALIIGRSRLSWLRLRAVLYSLKKMRLRDIRAAVRRLPRKLRRHGAKFSIYGFEFDLSRAWPHLSIALLTLFVLASSTFAKTSSSFDIKDAIDGNDLVKLSLAVDKYTTFVDEQGSDFIQEVSFSEERLDLEQGYVLANQKAGVEPESALALAQEKAEQDAIQKADEEAARQKALAAAAVKQKAVQAAAKKLAAAKAKTAKGSVRGAKTVQGDGKAFGSLVWPVGPGCKNGYHWYAMDCMRGVGTSIVAADGGTVSIAKYGWNWGYGNYVVIDHGNGRTSLYAHQTRLNVSAGQRVSRGQTIGFVGSTGNSRGSHLHFELHVGGVKVNPLRYF